MKIKRKDMQRTGWQRVLQKEYISEVRTFSDKYKGVISLSYWKTVSEPFAIPCESNDVIIIDSNYKWLQIALENQFFWMTAMFNNDNELIEIYFDITSGNHFDDEKNPYFNDMFLDLVVTSGKSIQILDEDELENALKINIITKAEYDLAIHTADKLYKYLTQYQDNIIHDCYAYLDEYMKKMENI